MITIDDKTYTEDDLNNEQKIKVQRMQQLQGELEQLLMRAEEVKCLLDVYGSSLKDTLTDDEKEEVIEE